MTVPILVAPRSAGAHRQPAAPPRWHGQAVVATVAVAVSAVGGTGALVFASQDKAEATNTAGEAPGTRPANSTGSVAPLALAKPASTVSHFTSVELPDSTIHDLAVVEKASRLAIEALNRPGAPYEAGDNSSLNGWIAKALGMLGLPQSLAPGVKRIIMAESNGNPRAINLTDSNARAGRPSQGLMQLIPSTFRAYVLPSLRDRPITDPVANITAGLRYMIQNYGLDTVRQGGRRGVSGGYIGY